MTPAVAGNCSARQLIARAVEQGLLLREAELLMQLAAQRDRAWLFARGTDPLEIPVIECYDAYVTRRLAGEPIAYISGIREFWSLPLSVSPAVLIPRPDTELLVQQALALVSKGGIEHVLDLGTGSGAIALALKSACPNLQVTGVDFSSAALEVARENGSQLNILVDWLQSDWFAELEDRRWPLIVSNPPYIADDDPHLSRGDLPAEPLHALASGADGLDAIRQIVAHAPDHLERGGWLLMEHGWDQGGAVRDLLIEAKFGAVTTHQDLAGHERVTGGRFG